uniref:Uncharacterized protein n=1 Tax=mine drainage metagenome TaxID=410659 RepID=E6QMW4_9ZZZZ
MEAKEFVTFTAKLQVAHGVITKANEAVLDALLLVASMDDPAFSAIFGMTPEAMQVIKSSSRRDFRPAASSGVPLFSLRINDPDVISALRHGEPSEKVEQAILNTFTKIGVPRGA